MMDGNTRIGLTPDMIENHRLFIPVWFRGAIVTIGKMESTLIYEELDRLEAEGVIKDHVDRTKYVLDYPWRIKFLESKRGDKWCKDRWVKHE
jgi:hypothetical protein